MIIISAPPSSFTFPAGKWLVYDVRLGLEVDGARADVVICHA